MATTPDAQAAGAGPGQTGAGDRAAFVREAMRRLWGERTERYAADAVPNHAPHAEALLDAVAPPPGARVLDVATGPGVAALQAAARVGPAGEVVATDLVPEWEPLVAAGAARAGLTNVHFRVMDAGELDFPDQTFDVALCQFGLMFVPDPMQALRELRRVLRPGGRLGVAVWSAGDRVPCAEIVQRHLAAVLPPAPPDQRLPTALALGETGVIERHVAAAGFRAVVSARRTFDYVAASAEAVWHDRVVNGRPQVRDAFARLEPATQARLHDAVVAELVRFERDGALRVPSEAIHVTAER